MGKGMNTSLKNFQTHQQCTQEELERPQNGFEVRRGASMERGATILETVES